MLSDVVQARHIYNDTLHNEWLFLSTQYVADLFSTRSFSLSPYMWHSIQLNCLSKYIVTINSRYAHTND